MKKISVIVLFLVLGLAESVNAQYRQEDYVAVLNVLDISDLRAAMTAVAPHGLNPSNYWTDEMEATYLREPQNPALKDEAKKNYLRLLQNISTGVVNPELMGPDVKLQKKAFVSAPQLQVLLLANGSKAAPLMESMAPKTPPYLSLKEALNRISSYCTTEAWQPLPPVKKEIKPGARSDAMPAIKERLRQLGYSIPSSDDVFDPATIAAVSDVQTTLRMNPDNIISPDGKVFRYLNTPCDSRLRQIRLDMEKMRWFPQSFENRYIFINLAMTYFTLMDNSGPTPFTMAFRTINGRPARKSPTMKDKIVYIVINPFWVVPPTIFREDKIEEIRNLPPTEIPNYFQSHNYEVWDREFTRRIDPTTIDWGSIDTSLDAEIYIRQKPHLGNALGGLKFMMTNSFAIYLHDTNQRELFKEEQRLLSSGCVRVERPLDLADYLLRGTPWTRDMVERYMAKPGEVLEAETRVALKQQMPVYMVFMTSQLSSDGVIRFVDDAYQQGSRLLDLGAW